MNLRQAGVCFWYAFQRVRNALEGAKDVSWDASLGIDVAQILVAFLQSERSGPGRKHLGTTQIFAVLHLRGTRLESAWTSIYYKSTYRHVFSSLTAVARRPVGPRLLFDRPVSPYGT